MDWEDIFTWKMWAMLMAPYRASFFEVLQKAHTKCITSFLLEIEKWYFSSLKKERISQKSFLWLHFEPNTEMA